jgi:hypothetical protein
MAPSRKLGTTAVTRFCKWMDRRMAVRILKRVTLSLLRKQAIEREADRQLGHAFGTPGQSRWGFDCTFR